MRTIRLVILVFAGIISTLSAYAQQYTGFLQKHICKSSTDGLPSRAMYVYLPKSYYEGRQHYPVVYLLHGANGNELSWIEKGHVLNCIDTLVSTGKICECIYIFPNTNRYKNDYDAIGSRSKRSVEAYLDLNGSAEYTFIKDITYYVDNSFRTLPSMKYRAIAGLSLGGLQTLYITANTCNYFAYIGLFSPIIYPPLYLGEYSYIYQRLEHKLHEQFESSPLLYTIMIGEDDPYYKSAYLFSEMLKKRKYNFTFRRTEGGHTWDNWRSYCLLFLQSLWKELPEETQEDTGSDS